jgi:glycosyltransferase involved in cell wall biosynthesis
VVGSSLQYISNKPSYYKFRNLDPVKRTIIEEEFAKRSFELDVITNAFKAAQRGWVDILHSYHDSSLFLTHYFHSAIDFPVVYSLHDPLPVADSFECQELAKFKDHAYIALSENMKQSLLKLNFVDTIYHGIVTADFPFAADASDYLLFMGRLVPEKGLHSAIQAALALNMRLEIGTQFPDAAHESDYFQKQIKPYLTSPFIGEPGMVTGSDKLLLYKEAKALLFPIEWEEPFGMVMIEAMVCGTPVIAYNRGSVSEIVKDGVTGFIVEPETGNGNQLENLVIKKRGVAGLVEAVQRINEIDRAACRKHVEEHFTVEKMVEGYEKVYKRVRSHP